MPEEAPLMLTGEVAIWRRLLHTFSMIAMHSSKRSSLMPISSVVHQLSDQPTRVLVLYDRNDQFH